MKNCAFDKGSSDILHLSTCICTSKLRSTTPTPALMANMRNITPASSSLSSLNIETPSDPLWYHEAEDRIHEKYSGEMHEIAEDIIEAQQEQEDEEMLHEATLAWLGQVAADEDKFNAEYIRHEQEVAGLLGLLRLFEQHLDEVLTAKRRSLEKLEKEKKKRGVFHDSDAVVLRKEDDRLADERGLNNRHICES